MSKPAFSRVMLPLSLVLAGCAVGPDYSAPEMALAATFVDGNAAPIGDVAAQRWWLAFNDPVLSDLVDTGLAQNLDIRLALARVAEAQAAARATGMPALVGGTVTGSVTRSGESDGGGATTRTAGFNPSLVVDLFGGERRAREQALAQLQGADLDAGTARLVFVSSLVSSYIDLRYYQSALAISRETVASRRETLELVQRQRQAGTATELAEAQAQVAVDEALAQLPGLEQGFYSSAYAIATLMGRPAQEILPRLERGNPQPAPRGSDVAAGVPADLLRNRPDIRSSERSFAAAVASVGVQEAQLYPSLTLGGNVSISGNNSWSFGPAVSVPVLNQGVLAANRDSAIAQAEQADLTWRAAVLSAIEEVQSAQSSLMRNRRAMEANRRATESSQRLVDLSRQTWEGGTTTLLDFLESERSLATSRLSLAAATRDTAASWASLQIAAGRGWRLE